MVKPQLRVSQRKRGGVERERCVDIWRGEGSVKMKARGEKNKTGPSFGNVASDC